VEVASEGGICIGNYSRGKEGGIEMKRTKAKVNWERALKRHIDNKPSRIAKFRADWLKKGYELVNITPLMEFKLGNSGCINGFNEPDEDAYHLQGWYRGESMAVFHGGGNNCYVCDEDKFVLYADVCDLHKDCSDNGDFIVFRKVKV